MECPRCHTELPNTAAFCHRCGGEVGGDLEPSDYRYAAFISYRHLPLDAEVAKQVQRAIETFRMPRGTVGTTLSDWPRPGKPLGNCFRDEDELSATHSLPESIRRALAQSRTLVVVCSPQTKESPWVRQEIEMFAQLHGRNRIVCVLASGSSDESIPPALKTRLMPDSQGVMREMPSQPLAADLREPSKSQRKTELLRIIAAVAGCNFDDLRQRQRTRKHRRIAIASLAATALAALIAALTFATASSTQSALIAESKNLAAASRDQFAHGDRMAAIETALSALPSNEADRSRPLVPEAQEALEQALLLDTSSSSAWVPIYNIQDDEPIAQFAYALNRLVVTMNAKGMIDIYSIWDGAHYLSIDVAPYVNDASGFATGAYRMETTPKGYIIVRSNEPTSPLLCFEASMGTLVWRLDETPANAFSVSEDGTSCAIAGFTDNSIVCKLIDLQTGEITSEATVDDFPAVPRLWHESYISPSDKGFFFTLGSRILGTRFGTDGSIGILPHEYLPCISDMQSYPNEDGIFSLAVLSFDPQGNDDVIGFQLQYLLNTSLADETEWEQSGTFTMNVRGPLDHWRLLLGPPQIRGHYNADNPQIVSTMGSKIAVDDLATGDQTYSCNLSSAIVGFGLLENTSENADGSSPAFLTATADGVLDVRRPDEYQELLGLSSQTQTGFYLCDAIFVRMEEGGIIATVQPAEEMNTLISYTWTSGAKNNSETSLDELIEKAHETLDRYYGYEFDGLLHPL